jgi:cyclic-di-GMP-binding protein
MATSSDGKLSVNTSPPLVNLEKANAWLLTLPVEDLAASRIHVLDVVTRFAQARDPLTMDGVTTLLHLDEGCQPVLNEILRGVLQAAATGRPLPLELYADMEAIYGRLASAYYRFVKMYHETRTSARQIAPFMALVLARALNALCNRAKWTYFRRQTLDAASWDDIHGLYRYVEQDQVETLGVALYAKPFEVSTCCGAMYMRAMLLGTLNTGNFAPRELETADRWLTAWCAQLSPDRAYVAERHFYLAYINSKEAARRVRGIKENEFCRYIPTGGIAIEIERTKERLRESQLQSDLGLAAQAESAEYGALLDRLMRLWAPQAVQGEQRRNRRVAVDNEPVQAVRGLNGLCESARQDFERAHGPLEVNPSLSRDEEMDLQVYGFVTERTRSKQRAQPLDTTQPVPAVEQWLLRDESVSGYGLTFPSTLYRDLKIGTLVGVKRRKGERWACGIVARIINKKQPDESIAGIDIVSHSPVIVILSEDVERNNPETSRSVWGLFVPGDKAVRRPDSIIVDPAHYASSKQMLMSARNVRYLIQLNRLMQSGEGWQRVTFDVLRKQI